LLLQATSQPGPTLINPIIVDRYRNCFPRADQNHDPFGAGDAGIEQIPLQQHIVLG
jgi:hypothetical protein